MSAKKRQAFTKRVIEDSNSSSSGDGVRLDMTHSTSVGQKSDDALFESLESLEPCMCFPLSTRCLTSLSHLNKVDEPDTLFLSDEHLVQTTPQLNYALRTRLREFFPRTAPLSLLVLHVSQLDQPALTPSMEPVYQKRRYHVTQDILVQVLNNVQRAVRLRDQLLLEEGVGAAMLFPSVDEQGIQNIVERIYRSICLLQAETIVPPLLRVTDIVLGCGTCKMTTQSGEEQSIERTIEELLATTGLVARRLLLRPALATSLWETMPNRESITSSSLSTFDEPLEAVASIDGAEHESGELDTLQEQYPQTRSTLTPYTPPLIHKHSARRRESGTPGTPGSSHAAIAALHDTVSVSVTQTVSSSTSVPSTPTIPFLHLPRMLSPRMKHLIPYTIARELQCAPVGRDHHKLTVAMANPTDHEAIQRLIEVTGMSIFPVSCEAEALFTLLAERW